MARIEELTVTIANAASLSGAVNLAGMDLTRIKLPAAWTAASLTFQVSEDGSTFQDLYDTSGEVTLTTPGTSRSVQVDPNNFAGIQWIKVRSGTSGTPVNQGGARSITLVAIGED